MAEKNYIAVAKKKVNRPSQDQTRARRRKILVYGRNKKGKSRFSLSAGVERTLVMDPEGGTDTMLQLNPYRWPVKRWEDTQEVYGAMKTGRLSPAILGLGPSKAPFEWLAVDGMSKIHSMCLNFVRKQAEERQLDRRPGLTTQRDYGRAGELLKQLMTNLDSLPIGVVYSAQERLISGSEDEDATDDEAGGDMRVVDLPQSVRGYLNSVVDVIGRIYVVRVKVKRNNEIKEVNQRRLWIGPHERYDTGFRSDFELPDFIKQPTIPKLVELMLTGKEKK